MSVIKLFYFQRLENPPGLFLQPRDLTILHLVAQYRFLDSDLISKLLTLYYPAFDERNLRRRLHKLWSNGFLERPIEQSFLQLRHPDQHHLIYCVSKEGAELLAQSKGQDTT